MDLVRSRLTVAAPVSSHRRDDPKHCREDNDEDRQFRRDPHHSTDRLLECVNRAGHRQRVHERAERKQNGQRGEIWSVAKAADARASRAVEELRAWYASRDRDVIVWAGLDAVETERAIEVPTFAGRNNPNSHPRWITKVGAPGARCPRMQSTVWHVPQTAGSRTRSSSGESVDAAKLNWPIGHRCLQKLAPVNTRSITRAAAK